MQSEPLPYRTLYKNDINKMYADELKKNFKTLPIELKIEFQKFTQNLMKEEYISRFCLLDAIRDFYKYFYDLCDTNYVWIKFTDNAWNYMYNEKGYTQ
jgi:hypothetical protein